MSLLLFEGFDDGLRDQRWVVPSLPNPTNVGSRLGLGQSFSSNGDLLSYSLPVAEQHATLTIGMWMTLTRVPSNPNPDRSFWQFRSDTGATVHVVMHFTPTLRLQVRRGDGTILGTTDVIYASIEEAHYIEISVTLHDTTGSVQVWVDGNNVLNLTNIDTKNAGTDAVFDQVRINESISGSDGFQPDIDDIYITNGAGASPYNGHLGDIVVETLFPDENGTYNAFVGSDADSVDNYLLVDESPGHDDDTTYVESDVDAARDSYGFTDLVSVSGAIRGVMATAIARNLGAADNLQISTRISAADYDSGDIVVPAGYAPLNKIWQVSPATGVNWVVAEINAAEFGIKDVV